jgi:hypothetical protein
VKSRASSAAVRAASAALAGHLRESPQLFRCDSGLFPSFRPFSASTRCRSASRLLLSITPSRQTGCDQNVRIHSRIIQGTSSAGCAVLNGSKFFSNLLHYVRTGDFIEALIADAEGVNEYAFALGALGHYSADNQGHPLAVNRAVPLMYPKLKKQFGNVVTYAVAEEPRAGGVLV